MSPKKERPTKPITLLEIGMILTFRLVILGIAAGFFLLAVMNEGAVRDYWIVTGIILLLIWGVVTVRWRLQLKKRLRATEDAIERRNKEAEP